MCFFEFLRAIFSCDDDLDQKRMRSLWLKEKAEISNKKKLKLKPSTVKTEFPCDNCNKHQENIELAPDYIIA